MREHETKWATEGKVYQAEGKVNTKASGEKLLVVLGNKDTWQRGQHGLKVMSGVEGDWN